MKAVKKLIEAVGNMRVGNHSTEKSERKTRYIYHNTAICTVEGGTFTLDNGGYFTPSTKRALSAYRKELQTEYIEILTLTVDKRKRDGTFECTDQVDFKWVVDPNNLDNVQLEVGAKYQCDGLGGTIIYMEKVTEEVPV